MNSLHLLPFSIKNFTFFLQISDILGLELRMTKLILNPSHYVGKSPKHLSGKQEKWESRKLTCYHHATHSHSAGESDKYQKVALVAQTKRRKNKNLTLVKLLRSAWKNGVWRNGA